MNEEEQKILASIKHALMQSQYRVVVTQCQKLLTSSSNDNTRREAQYLQAVAYRLSGDADNAIQCLTTLVAAFPDYGRAFQELGYCYSKLGNH